MIGLIRKASWPGIKKFGICKWFQYEDDNKIRDAPMLVEMHAQNHCEVFAIEFMQEQFADVSWFIKIELARIDSICTKMWMQGFEAWRAFSSPGSRTL